VREEVEVAAVLVERLRRRRLDVEVVVLVVEDDQHGLALGGHRADLVERRPQGALAVRGLTLAVAELRVDQVGRRVDLERELCRALVLVVLVRRLVGRDGQGHGPQCDPDQDEYIPAQAKPPTTLSGQKCDTSFAVLQGKPSTADPNQFSTTRTTKPQRISTSRAFEGE
jgi:hypothetical protein